MLGEVEERILGDELEVEERALKVEDTVVGNLQPPVRSMV